MAKKLNIVVGGIYGRITVEATAESPYPHHFAKEQWYICRCECGNEFIASAYRINKANITCPVCAYKRRAITRRQRQQQQHERNT